MSGTAELAVLHDRRILVVEDEYMLADEVAEILGNAGVEVLGPAANIESALHLVAEHDWIDGALLDVNLQGEMVWPLIDALMVRNVPVVLVTGYDADVIPRPYADLPRHEKPATARDFVQTLARMMTPS
ncbi:response regulator [Roseomonas elaeocarpi]|uniref:Response regulator n=1 Tax=Roseomonas elaeocarpi TaxID=907779 RepID=A0ABV6JWX4_9PROT